MQLVTTSVLSKVSGGYQAVVTVKNSGTGTAQAVQLTGATLGGAGGSVIPQTIGNIAPGGSAAVVVTFPATAGGAGACAGGGVLGSVYGGAGLWCIWGGGRLFA